VKQDEIQKRETFLLPKYVFRCKSSGVDYEHDEVRKFSRNDGAFNLHITYTQEKIKRHTFC